jgi:hypothetical protein
MTQLGSPTQEALEIRKRLASLLAEFEIQMIDADSIITGKDFLVKIWSLLIAVPLGVAIVHEDMSPNTLSNIFYEFGVLQAYGKETLIIKTKAAKVPSDFVRTEYVQYDAKFNKRIRKFMRNFLELAAYYEDAADHLERNPLLSVDYLRRAYLISGREELRSKTRELMKRTTMDGRAKNSVEMLLANF